MSPGEEIAILKARLDAASARCVALREALSDLRNNVHREKWTTAECLACGCDPHVEHCDQCDARRAENAATSAEARADAALADPDCGGKGWRDNGRGHDGDSVAGAQVDCAYCGGTGKARGP